MKKIYKSILFAIIAAAGFTACSDYEAPDITTESAISIVSHDTTFPAAASTGSITFEAKGPVTVTSGNEWITATLDGNRIDIAVAQNNALEGRTGTIIVKCGNATDEISIIQSGIIFKFDEVGSINIDSDAWTNSYEANATIPMSVTSDAEWLKGSIADGILTINADRNTKLQSRTGILTITVGDLTYDITVNQGPLTFPLVKVTEISQNDDAKTYTYDFPTDIEVTFSSDVEWLHGSFENETVTITVDANNDGHIRTGSLSYSLEGAEGTVEVKQFEFAKDIAGEYMFVFTNTSTGKLSYFNSVLTGTESSCSIDIPALNFSIPVVYNNDAISIGLFAGQYIGDYNNYKVFTTLWDTDAGYLTWSATASMDAPFKYIVEDDGTGVTIAEFMDNGSYPGYVVSAIRLEAFTSTTLGSSTRFGSLSNLLNPYLMRIHENTEAATIKTQASKRHNISKSIVEAVPGELTPASSIVKDNLRTR